MKIKAFCKVNFFLEINKKIDNSPYHEIKSVMKTINFYDDIKIREICGYGVQIKGPKFENNSVLKAAELFLKKAASNKAFLISYKKNVPHEAGLGGASADAVGVLLGLNKIFNNRFSKEELLKMAIQLGSDAPFFVDGGCKLVSKTGEDLHDINWGFNIFLVIVKPSFGISTKEAYQKFDALKIENFKDPEEILRSIEKRDINKFCKNLFNRFEEVLNIDQIFLLKRKFIENGAIASLLSGSGSCVFGIFEDKEIARKCYLKFKKEKNKVFLASSNL